MVTVVVVLNTLIALFCFFAAWKIKKLRRRLAKIAETLTSSERRTNSALSRSPKVIYKGQRGAERLNERYQKLEPQLKKLRKVLPILSLVQKVRKGKLLKLR
jgi:hypothetical protein